MDLNERLRPISYKKNALEAVVGRAVFHQIGNGGSTPKKSPKMGGACDGLWRKGRASTREASGETDSRRWGGVGGYNMRKVTSQKIKEVKYLLSVLWDKKLLS